ncbi:hypothetical protein Dimus_036206 [Dionaea muscipula]
MAAASWEEWWHWLVKISVGRTAKAKQRKRIATMLTYEIRQECNAKIFSSRALPVDSVINRVLLCLGVLEQNASLLLLIFLVFNWFEWVAMLTLSCWGKWAGGVGWDEGLLCWVSSDDEVLDWWRLICGAFDGVLLLLSCESSFIGGMTTGAATVMLLRDFDCVGVFWGGLVARGESLVGFDCGV